MSEKTNPRIRFSGITVYKASRTLQGKSGYGKLDQRKIDDAKQAVQEAEYRPFAAERIEYIGELVNKARTGGDYQQFVSELVKVVVHLKSTASTFGYDVIADLTAIMLEFLELTSEFDKDVIDLVEGHQKTLAYLVNSHDEGTTEKEAEVLKQELYEACRRYRSKNHID